MPSIKFDGHTIKKVKSKQGVYSSLNKARENKYPVTNVAVEQVAGKLKPLITELVKAAFIEYARKRGCKPEMERLEWTLFNKSLQKRL